MNQTTLSSNELRTAWLNSLSFPVGVALLLYLRVYYGYDWPFPATVGLAILCIAPIRWAREIFVPLIVGHGYSRVLRRQLIYSSVWTSMVGIWLYWQLWGDFGLLLVIGSAVCLWPASHLEVHRLTGRYSSPNLVK